MRITDLLQSIKSEGINPAYLGKVKDELNRFLEGKDEVNGDLVPKEIVDSWYRSRANRVDPYEINSFPVDPSRKKELERFNDILTKYNFFFQNVIELFDQNEFSLGFGTIDGLRQIISNKIGLSFPGFIGTCSEKIVGTTANSLAIGMNKPAFVLEPFYYRQDYFKNYNSAAAPIHNEKNEVIGSLSLGYKEPNKTLQAYCLVSLIAKVFDSLYLPLTMGYEKQIKQIVDCLPQGILFVNEKNTTVYYNEKALELLKINKNIEAQRTIDKYLPKLGVGASFNNKKVKTNVHGKEVNANIIHDEIKDELTEKVYRLIQLQDNDKENKSLSKSLASDELFTFEQIVGNCASIKEAKKIAVNVAKTSVPVMILGESGTGKEMFAQAIHNASPRRDHPFIAINCGAIPGELVESELFGYEEGSFTGALKGGKSGKIEAASGGTLFLDEIESMPLKDQIKLLRVISTGKVQKIGSTQEKCIDVRLVSATKTDLLKLADEGLFREDLYFRISTFVIELPPLRARKDDIAMLAEEFLKKLSAKYSLPRIQMDQTFVNALCSYHWRGNVRELEHAIERAAIMLGDGEKLLLEHLSEKIQAAYKEITTQELVHEAIERSSNKQGLLALAEKMVIEHVLESVDGNVSAAAEQLGINRRTIYNKMQDAPNIKVYR